MVNKINKAAFIDNGWLVWLVAAEQCLFFFVVELSPRPSAFELGVAQMLQDTL